MPADVQDAVNLLNFLLLLTGESLIERIGGRHMGKQAL